MPLAAYLDRWIDDVSAGTVRPTTLTIHHRAARSISAEIGTVRLCDLRPAHIQRCITRLLDHLAPSTVRREIQILRQALKTALEWDMLSTNRNPASLITLPPDTHEQITTLSPEQVARLIDGTRGTRYGALWHLLVIAGLRRGEALALEWSDLDHDRLSITRTLHKEKDQDYRTGPPKTRSSRRDVYLPSGLVSTLHQHHTTYGLPRAIGTPDLMFPSAHGTYIGPTNVHRFLSRDLEQLGLPHVSAHQLRHTAATLRLQRPEIHPTIVQEMLGHSSIAMTLDTYSHVGQDLHRAAAAAIERLIETSGPAVMSETLSSANE
jgi:integrase